MNARKQLLSIFVSWGAKWEFLVCIRSSLLRILRINSHIWTGHHWYGTRSEPFWLLSHFWSNRLGIVAIWRHNSGVSSSFEETFTDHKTAALFWTGHYRSVWEDWFAFGLILRRKETHVRFWCQPESLFPGSRHHVHFADTFRHCMPIYSISFQWLTILTSFPNFIDCCQSSLPILNLLTLPDWSQPLICLGCTIIMILSYSGVSFLRLL